VCATPAAYEAAPTAADWSARRAELQALVERYRQRLGVDRVQFSPNPVVRTKLNSIGLNLKFLKFGFARATDIASLHVRRGASRATTRCRS